MQILSVEVPSGVPLSTRARPSKLRLLGRASTLRTILAMHVRSVQKPLRKPLLAQLAFVVNTSRGSDGVKTGSDVGTLIRTIFESRADGVRRNVKFARQRRTANAGAYRNTG